MTNLLDNAGGLLGPRGSELIWSFKLNLCTGVDLPERTSGTSDDVVESDDIDTVSGPQATIILQTDSCYFFLTSNATTNTRTAKLDNTTFYWQSPMLTCFAAI